MNWADWLVAHGQADPATVAEAERVLEAAALQPGDSVLDLGAGLGLLTLAAHERIGDGWVIAVDSSVGALEELLRLAHEVGANGIMYLVGDAEVLPLPDAAVDVAVLRSVLTHVDDVASVVRELARVIRAGGRLSLCEPLQDVGTDLATAVDWSPLGALGERIAAEGAAFAAADSLQPLAAEELVAQLGAAGFTDIEHSVEDPGEVWEVTGDSVDARLDARSAPAALSLRERWRAAFGDDELAAIVARLERLAGTTIAFATPRLFLSARRA